MTKTMSDAQIHAGARLAKAAADLTGDITRAQGGDEAAAQRLRHRQPEYGSDRGVRVGDSADWATLLDEDDTALSPALDGAIKTVLDETAGVQS